jgi:hypothetical protein
MYQNRPNISLLYTTRKKISSLLCVVLALLIWLCGNTSLSPRIGLAHKQTQSYALLIGINQYRSIKPPLRWARADVRRMRELLVNYGFPPQNIRSLEDHQATHQAMLQGMNWLKEVAKSNDRVVVFFAGYGSNINMVLSKQTANHNVLIHYDFEQQALNQLHSETSSNAMFTDKWLKKWLSQFRTQKITVILDTCFASNPNTNERSGERSRCLYTGRRDIIPVAVSSSASASSTDLFATPSKYMLLMASQRRELAKEHNRFRGGLLTWALYHTIQSWPHRSAVQFSQISSQIAKMFSRSSSLGQISHQHPVLLGNRRDLQAAVFFANKERTDDVVSGQKRFCTKGARPFCLSVWIDKNSNSRKYNRNYIDGELFFIYVKSNLPARLQIWTRATSKPKYLQLFPSIYHPDFELQPEKIYQWPPRGRDVPACQPKHPGSLPCAYNIRAKGPPGIVGVKIIATPSSGQKLTAHLDIMIHRKP